MLKLQVKLTVHPWFLFAMQTLTAFACAVILLASALAFAHTHVDQGPALVLSQTADAGSPTLGADVGAVAEQANSVISVAKTPGSPWYLVLIAALVALCRLFKRFAPRIPQVGPWLVTHPWGDWVVSIAVSLLGALLSALLAHQKVDLALVMTAITAGLGASGLPLNLFGVGPSAPSAAQPKADGAAVAADAQKTTDTLNS